MIKEKLFMTVKDWNAKQRNDKRYILVYTLGNGSMVDEPRQYGYVVQKRHEEGGERSKFHKNRAEALKDYNSDIF